MAAKKKRRGRPKGSKNKRKSISSAQKVVASGLPPVAKGHIRYQKGTKLIDRKITQRDRTKRRRSLRKSN